MIEKLKLEPYIPESLVAHLYSSGGHLVAERYDTIYWVRDEFLNVKCEELDCFVDAKLFCAFAQSIKSIAVKEVKKENEVKKAICLTLFNKAKYDLDMVKGENIPTYEFGELPHKSAFDFGGVENATSKSPLEKELNTVYVDDEGCVASDSIVAGVSSKFKSDIPFAVPESIHGMLNGAEAEWGIFEGKLYIAFGVHKIVAVLSRLPDFKWWDSSRAAFGGDVSYTDVSGLKSSLSRLANFGSMVYIRSRRIAVNKDHWEPFALEGSGETFDISNLGAIATDEKVGVALVEGNLYLKTSDAEFVCCAVDVDSSVQEEFDPEDLTKEEEPESGGEEVEKPKPKKKSKKSK